MPSYTKMSTPFPMCSFPRAASFGLCHYLNDIALRVVFLYPRLQGDFDLLGKLLEAGFDLFGDVTAYTAVQGLELLVVLIF